jgi:hypothetical protein
MADVLQKRARVLVPRTALTGSAHGEMPETLSRPREGLRTRIQDSGSGRVSAITVNAGASPMILRWSQSQTAMSMTSFHGHGPTGPVGSGPAPPETLGVGVQRGPRLQAPRHDRAKPGRHRESEAAKRPADCPGRPSIPTAAGRIAPPNGIRVVHSSDITLRRHGSYSNNLSRKRGHSVQWHEPYLRSAR